MLKLRGNVEWCIATILADIKFFWFITTNNYFFIQMWTNVSWGHIPVMLKDAV